MVPCANDWVCAKAVYYLTSNEIRSERAALVNSKEFLAPRGGFFVSSHQAATRAATGTKVQNLETSRTVSGLLKSA